jgi:diaminohydroxyphosphoribosylaminopyrimidine deaminase / 5-amino-6-(5-phosphoribosylamino)uracil reductase
MAGDQRYMRLALRAAFRGRGRVEPNPRVGAVLVREGRVLAIGHHEQFGGPHAEVVVLHRCRERGIDPAGSDLYVTLEPCCHLGKTPPCTDALISAQVRRVFAAMQDPNPLVAGKGFDRLRQAGIESHVGLCEGQARAALADYLKRVATGLPWVIAKWAQTIDGAAATSSGESRWISGPASRAAVHRLRARVDAVMVGIGTVLADNPRLTARGVARRRVARRVVVDPQLRIPLSSDLVRSAGEAPLLVATRHELAEAEGASGPLRARGVEVLGLPPRQTGAGEDGELDLRPLLLHLSRKYAAANVLVEGGPTLLGRLLAQGLVDQALVFVAPLVMGDAGARHAVAGVPRPRLAEIQPLRLHRVKRLGPDVLLDYRSW